MKSIFLLALLLLIQNETEYAFNYNLTYEQKNHKTGHTLSVNYFLNSTQNNFYGKIYEQKNKTALFYFRDQDQLTYRSEGSIALALDGNTETLKIAKSSTKPFTNSLAGKAKKYTLETLSDTLINDKRLARVVFIMQDLKRAKREKIGKEVYLIDTSQNMKPFLTNPTSLNIWRIHKNMPEGLIVEKHIYQHTGELIWSEKLTASKPISFKIIISAD